MWWANHDPGAQPFGYIYPAICLPLCVLLILAYWGFARYQWRYREQNRIHTNYVGGPLEEQFQVPPRRPHELCTWLMCVDRRNPGPCTHGEE